MKKDLLLLRLEKSLNERLDALAKSKGRHKSELVRQAIERLIEDEEDLLAAERAISSTRIPKTLRDLMQELGPRG